MQLIVENNMLIFYFLFYFILFINQLIFSRDYQKIYYC